MPDPLSFHSRTHGMFFDTRIDSEDDLLYRLRNYVEADFGQYSERGGGTTIAHLRWQMDGSIRFEAIGVEVVVRMERYDASVKDFLRRVCQEWARFTAQQEVEYTMRETTGDVRTPYRQEYCSMRGQTFLRTIDNARDVHFIGHLGYGLRLVYMLGTDAEVVVAGMAPRNCRDEFVLTGIPEKTDTIALPNITGAALDVHLHEALKRWDGYALDARAKHERAMDDLARGPSPLLAHLTADA